MRRPWTGAGAYAAHARKRQQQCVGFSGYNIYDIKEESSSCLHLILLARSLVGDSLFLFRPSHPPPPPNTAHANTNT